METGVRTRHCVFRGFSALLAIFLLMFSTSCANIDFDEMSKATRGALGGAAVGAVAGGLATGDVRGAVVGAIVGGFIGNRIGAYLDERDQEELRKLQIKALQNGEEQSFVTRKTGDRLTITPGKIEQKTQTYELAEGVREYALLSADEVSIATYVSTPVYSGVDPGRKPRYVLKRGSALHVPMRVAGQPDWGVVVDKNAGGGGRITGYVRTSFLDPGSAREYRPPAKVRKKTDSTRVAVRETPPPSRVQQAAEPESRTASVSPPPKQEEETSDVVLVGEAPKSEAAAKPVELNLKCRSTWIKVKDVREEMRYCEKPPPRWVQV
jgi:molybdopterin-binding protein